MEKKLNREMAELERVCERKGIRVVKERYIMFGEGVIYDAEQKIVIVSDNASADDIKLATEYIENNVEKLTDF